MVVLACCFKAACCGALPLPITMKRAVLILAAVLLSTCSRAPSLMEEILALGELRVVTRSSPNTWYQGPDGHAGPEYELSQGFADFLGVELVPLEAQRFQDLLGMVETGQAHFAAAGLTVTNQRKARVIFGPRYQTVQQQLVYRLGSGRPRSFQALRGKQLTVVPGTAYIETLSTLQDEHRWLVWTENPHADVAELLVAVNQGKLDHTVADSSLFNIYRHYLPEIRIAFDLSNRDRLAWAFAQDRDRSLVIKAREYFAGIREDGTLERILDRYYGHVDDFDYVGARTLKRHYRKRLPLYEQDFRDVAEAMDVDWRLLAAIGYQESHWNPEAISPTGVRGLMMLTQVTADTVGIEDRDDPVQSIIGGARYLQNLRDRLPENIEEPDRTWLALAAYNVGMGHLRDARKLTREFGGDPDSWIELRETLPLLSQRKWYSQVPHGYARGWEPVQYVENIRRYYSTLLWLTAEDERADPENNVPGYISTAKNEPAPPDPGDASG